MAGRCVNIEMTTVRLFWMKVNAKYVAMTDGSKKYALIYLKNRHFCFVASLVTCLFTVTCVSRTYKMRICEQK